MFQPGVGAFLGLNAPFFVADDPHRDGCSVLFLTCIIANRIEKSKTGHMRKIIYGINLSADGCCDHTKFSGSEGTHEYFTNLMRDVDLIIYGRKTYELMVPYWPEVAKKQSENKAENEFAQTFDAIDKIVFSRSLDKVEGNTRIIRANLAEEVLKLKQEPGKNISIGGVSLPSQLMAFGLVDEFYFLVHPALAGQGRRLFDDINLQKQLDIKLIDSQVFPSGCIALHYLKQW
jgi:dihydrofolate reductase